MDKELKRRIRDKELKKKYQQKYYQKHHDKLLQRSKDLFNDRYRHDPNYKERRHREAALYYKKHKEDIFNRRKQYRKGWMRILTELGFLSCRICGYDKCFYAIDLHHPNPTEKELQPSQILIKKPSEKWISQIRRLIPLCCRCHREVHSGVSLWTKF